MATVTNGTGDVVSATQAAAYWMWIVKEFLKANTSWTVPGSGKTGSGGMGSDVVGAVGEFDVSGAWMVLQSPDASMQILFARGAATYNISAYLNPAADYSGGGAAGVLPTSAAYPTNGHNIWTTSQFLQSNTVQRLHITAETGTGVPGWAVYTHYSGDFTSGTTLAAIIPMVNPDPNDVDPWVMFWGGGNLDTATYWSSESAVLNNSHCWAVQPNASTVTGCSALYQCAVTLAVWPSAAGVNTDSDEMLIPITFARRAALANGHYKGVSNYVRWPSATHAPCSTLNGLTRILFKDTTFPWDGVSVPSVS